jgi:hypothetical protein
MRLVRAVADKLHLTGLILSSRECKLESGNGHSPSRLSKGVGQGRDFGKEHDSDLNRMGREMANGQRPNRSGMVWYR